MKKLTVFALLLVLCLCLCACRESEKPEEIADIPNIDQNILDAHRHLGNSYENYSSEDTLLVEYGNRIYHAYNSRQAVMEYCVKNGKEVPLGIYGTDLSVYKNILYYIGKDSTSIHAYDLATGIDSVWITGEDIVKKLPNEQKPTGYFSPQLGDLTVSDYGLSFIIGHSDALFVHMDFAGNLSATHFLSWIASAHDCSVIPLSDTKIVITHLSLSDIVVFDLQTYEIHKYPTNHMIYKSLSTSDGAFYIIVGFDCLMFKVSEDFSTYLNVPLPHNNTIDIKTIAICNNRMFYGTIQPSSADMTYYYSFDESDSILAMNDVELTNMTFTSNNLVFAITNDNSERYLYNQQTKKYIMADFDFTSTYVLDEKYESFR